jgi:hypothetical protein
MVPSTFSTVLSAFTSTIGRVAVTVTVVRLPFTFTSTTEGAVVELPECSNEGELFVVNPTNEVLIKYLPEEMFSNWYVPELPVTC